MDSEVVSVPGVKECPVLESIVTAFHPVGEDEDGLRNRIVSIELKIVKIRIEENILRPDDIITLILISGDRLS